MFTAAMEEEEPNNKRYFHYNKFFFPKENLSIVSLLQYGHSETLYSRPVWISQALWDENRKIDKTSNSNYLYPSLLHKRQLPAL